MGVRWAKCVRVPGLDAGCTLGLQVQRGGWAAGRGEYRLLVQAAGEAAPRVEKVAFSGLEDELAAFVAQARSHSLSYSGAGSVGFVNNDRNKWLDMSVLSTPLFARHTAGPWERE